MGTSRKILRLSWVYLLLSILLFLLEFVIERYTHDDFIRPYVGDFFVVMLLYTLVRSILNISPLPTALVVLFYSYVLEFTQYLQLSRILGVDQSWIGRLILGNYFAWGDLIAYTAGILVVILLEKLFSVQRNQARVA
ncbi:ribosomal maturation YjgA family protein [Pedobacter duraquae]|uniref:Uncharacterized protein DUF2809 n=1 Tax=Pedobacter duraquae TaxID=425511 RepID=A0A4R6IK80_9SPHI|nr:DUF2809 domain-containing protein [Pedobacter duraquae]TDO22433.1 uncharacterized protein DUF2809 [Pedobacter duraquae]